MPLLLTACGTAASSDKSPVRKMIAPDVVQYAKVSREAVALEILGGQCPASIEMLKDYKVMRDQAREIR